MKEPTVNTKEELEKVLSEISFVNTVLDFKWKFEYKPVVMYDENHLPRDAWLVWVSFERPDTITGEMGRGRGRDEIVWVGATVSGVVKTCWVLVELMVRHELMEGFRWKNKRIFNPHNSVFALASLQAEHDLENGLAKIA